MKKFLLFALCAIASVSAFAEPYSKVKCEYCSQIIINKFPLVPCIYDDGHCKWCETKEIKYQIAYTHNYENGSNSLYILFVTIVSLISMNSLKGILSFNVCSNEVNDEIVEFKAGEFKLVSLGISMRLPEGYEAHIAPRSSTFKNYGLIQTNSIGIIDNSYSSDKDIYKWPAFATRDTVVHVNDRICQFRIEKKMPKIKFETVEILGNKNRGGIGSTGRL